MHVADRRHGLDVVGVAAGRRRRPTPISCVAGLLHDAGKGDTGVWPRVAYALGQRYGTWIWRAAAFVPGFGPALERLRDHARDLRGDWPPPPAARPRTVALIRHQDAPTDPEFGRAAPARGRGQLMAIDGLAACRRAGRHARPGGGTGPSAREPRRRSSSPSSTARSALLLSLIEARQLDVLTVPLGALADAYLDALGRLEADRLGNVSAFVAIASQLILIKSRAMLPRRTDRSRPDGPGRRRHRPGGRAARPPARSIAPIATPACGWPRTALARIGLVPTRALGAARAAGLAGARPAGRPAARPGRLVRALDRLAAIAPPPERPPEVLARTITMTERADDHPRRAARAPTVVLQDLLTGVRDRVVIAITFLAMLELMKRREIVVEQAEPWGPIVARATTAEERTRPRASRPIVDAPIDETLESFA